MRQPAAVVLAAVLVASCSGTDESPEDTPPSGEDHERTLVHDGQQRTYLLHVPDSVDESEPAAIVVALHFAEGSPAEMQQLSGLDVPAAEHGFMVAYPAGIDGEFNGFSCCGDTDDVGFVAAVIDDVAESWPVDPDRVYATGISRGAEMAYRLAIESPETFAAVAPVSGGFAGLDVPDTPVSVVTFIGSDDRIAPAAQAGIERWRDELGCSPSEEPQSDSVSRTVATCEDGSEVVTYLIDGMGHSWPGGPELGLGAGQLGAPDTEVNAAEVIAEFFATHSR